MEDQLPASMSHPEDGSDSSLTLSITPPLSETQKDESSTISEHLSSIENDRSMQEVEVNVLENFNVLLQNLPPDEEQKISQEPKPPSLNSSYNSSSIISLNGLDTFIGVNTESRNNARSILEEILNDSQFKSNDSNTEESLDIFANVDLSDKFLNSYHFEQSDFFNFAKNDSVNEEVNKQMHDFEELLAIKDTTIAALTSELDSFREMVSNTSSNSLGTSTTEYKQFQEECHNKLVEYHSAILHKDDQIEKLTISLQKALFAREEMKENFKNEIAQLQEQLEKTSQLLKEHNCSPRPVFSFKDSCSKFEAALEASQLILFDDVKTALNEELETRRKETEAEICDLKHKLEVVKAEQEKEVSHLKGLLESAQPQSGDVLDLKQELDAKHSKEMEELRTYFEKKCADLEKNYSEEVFSQQSRKLSASSSCSEADLSSDFAFAHSGPAGDCKIEYTKKDITKFHQALTQIISLFDGVNLNDLTDNEFERLKNELNKIELKNVIKFDLALIKNELQNKYHAELEILREDFDNRVDIMNVEYKEKLRNLEKKYLEEIDDLNLQLRGRLVVTTQQEVNSGEFEIDEVVQSYERRLQEQVTLAKIDIIAALESQIQRLVASDSIDDDWPEELLQLKARFAEKYQHEIIRLNNEHSEEIARLKEEHMRTLNAALERARRRSLKDADSLSKGELELLKERDALKKQSLALRNLLGELIKYFTQCEDELNNTLVEELITKNFTQIEKELESPRDSLGNVKRVHIAPNFNDLINLIDNSSENDLDSIDLKSELGSCLEKLKSEANAILTLSTSFSDEKNFPKPRNSLDKEMSSLTRKLINETQIKNTLVEQLDECKSIIQSLETDRGSLENQLEQLLQRQKDLEGDLLQARAKIAELIENGHKEIISEGYGENGERAVSGLAETVVALAALQEKVRSISENPGSLDSDAVRLMEDLARVGDHIIEEARRENEDLTQQIDAADKKYKITCQFVEDQAAEREQERDEAQKEITLLKDQLKDREKDRANYERIANEVEHLEQQLRDMSVLIQETQKRCKEAQEERKEAVDKIFELRDIIRDLEEQVKSKTTAEEDLRDIVNELELLVRHQTNQNDNQEEPTRDVSNVERLHQYVGNLESEVQKLRLSSEIAGSEGALQQIKNHLCEFETTLDKRTKDLEGLHSTVSNTTCSSPSEDMSIRDVVHQERSIYDECEVPLQQLARLKEKLVRHSRAEDAAVKRVRDLELQVLGLRSDLEESQHERDILKKQTSDHLVLISNLQIRLDEQRIRAEHIEKQTNTSLEVQNYDLKNAIASLEEKIGKRDKTIAQLKMQIEETKQHLQEREEEFAAKKDDDLVVHMQEQLERLRSENLKLKTKVDQEVMLPNLVESIISEKNNDIEKLRLQLSESEKQLQLFTSLSLDKKEIEYLNKLRLSGISFHDIIDLENLERDRRDIGAGDSLQLSPITRAPRNEKTVFLDSEPEISNIEKAESFNHFYSLQVPQTKGNSTEKHVRFEDEVSATKISELHDIIVEKDQLIKDYENKLERFKELQTKIDQLQVSLEETEDNLKKATKSFQEEQKQSEERINGLRLELASQRCDLTQREDELKQCQTQLDKERHLILEREDELQRLKEAYSSLEVKLRVKCSELNSHEETLKIQNEEVKKLREEVASLTNQKETVDFTNKSKDLEISKLQQQHEDVRKELIHVQNLVIEKDKVIHQMEMDSKSLHVNLETIQSKLQETGNVIDLGRRLREEQIKNSELYEELHILKAQLLGADKKSLDDIAGQVQRELDYSARLDASLLSAVSDGSGDNEDVDALKIAVKKQKSVNKQLVKSREAVEKKLHELENMYDKLKIEHNKIQYEDAMLIGELRRKLESSLKSEELLDKKLRVQKLTSFDPLAQKITALNSTYNSLPETNHEFEGITKMVNSLGDENSELKKELKKLNEQNQEERASRLQEVTRLENRLAEMSSGERLLKQTVDKMSIELEATKKELLKNNRHLEEVEQDRRKILKALEQKSKLSDPLSDELLTKMKELNEIARNDRDMMALIERLKYENSVLEERVAILQDRKSNTLPFDDPVARANYLFAKYLRSESYRKALVWQKAYLTSLLETYHEKSPNVAPKKRKSISPLNRFKCVAVMIVSLFRMKYLVRRWHSGKRIAEQRSSINQHVQFQVGQPVSSQNFTSNVSNTAKSALNESKTDLPWFGTSPPSKETHDFRVYTSETKSSVAARKRLGPSEFHGVKDTATPGNLNRFPITVNPTLSSSGILSKYIERYNLIQDKYGLDPSN